MKEKSFNPTNVITQFDEVIKLIDKLGDNMETYNKQIDDEEITGIKPTFTEAQLVRYNKELYDRIYRLAEKYVLNTEDSCPFCPKYY